jgi:hypothetical protein
MGASALLDIGQLFSITYDLVWAVHKDAIEK